MIKHRILIADDHQLIIDGLEKIIQSEESFDLIHAVNNGQEVVDFISEIPIDLIIMDLDMPKKDGIETTKYLKEHFPEIKILILTMHNASSVIKNLIKIGADGYILKNSDKHELIIAIKQLLAGKKYFSVDVTSSLAEEKNELPTTFENKIKLTELTEREIEILKLIAEGSSNKEIGDKLFISHRTVDTHRSNLMEKLDIKNVAGLIKFAFKNNLIH